MATMETIHGIMSARPLDGYKVDVEFDTEKYLGDSRKHALLNSLNHVKAKVAK